MPNVNSYGRPAALSAKEMQREMLMQMMMSGEEAPPPPEPVQDMRAGMGGRAAGARPGAGSSPAGGATQARFTAESVDRYHLCGCSPFALLIGTSSAMLPPLDRDGYRKTRSDDLKEAWSALPQEEKDAYGFELELLQFLSKLVGNMDQKVTDKKAAQAGTEPPQLVDDVSGFVYNPAEVRDRVGAGVRVGIRVGVRPPASSTSPDEISERGLKIERSARAMFSQGDVQQGDVRPGRCSLYQSLTSNLRTHTRVYWSECSVRQPRPFREVLHSCILDSVV